MNIGLIPVEEEAPSAEGGQPLSSALEDFLIATSRMASAISDLSIFADRGVGPAGWALLKLLQSEPVTTDQLAHRASLSRQRVRVQIKELEDKRFLTVTRQNVGDRRVRMVRISLQGLEALQDISAWLETYNSKEGQKKFASAVKQMRVLQRRFLQDRRTQAQLARVERARVAMAADGAGNPVD